MISRIHLFMFTVLVITTLLFFNSASFSESAAEDDVQLRPTFSLETDPFYGNAEQVLQQLADKKASTAKNNFCVIGYKDDTNSYAYVYWKESNKLILWEPGTEGSRQKLWLSHRYLDLKQDVVPTENDLHGSTYLLPQDWVNSLLADCSKRGRNFSIIVEQIKHQ